MRLIGRFDSPFVRRVAVSAHLMGLSFDHEPISLFNKQDSFIAINPLLKAPTLITDEGITLMDSTLILEYLDRLVSPEMRMKPSEDHAFVQAQKLIGLALVACEKTVQLVYEFRLRPVEKQHAPWAERVQGQLSTAYRLLEADVASRDRWLLGDRPLQPDISIAVAWRFTQLVMADRISPGEYTALTAFSQRAEELPAFSACRPELSVSRS